MKRLLTITFALLLAGVLLTACSRRHSSTYQGVATKMNFGRQVIDPKAPTDPDLPQEVPGAIGESIYKRHTDTYSKPAPDCLFQESCTYGTSPAQQEGSGTDSD